MNNTLTGLGLALVLALVAALVGPLFVNWNAYRDDFAAQASALIGAPVAVRGAVEARLLPSPYVRFRDVSAGEGVARLEAAEIEITLAIGPLLRGDVTAERVKLVRPRLAVAIDADGAVSTPFGAKGSAGPDADRIAFNRADVIDGSIEVTAPAGRVAITKLSGVAEAGSLRGPFKFDGKGETALGTTTLRLGTARADASGAVRLKLGGAVDGRPETFEADGLLTVARTPRFEGQATLARPAPKPAPGAKAEDAARFDPPWRITSKIAGDAARLVLDDIDASYGLDERAVRLAGKGALSLGGAPRFELALGTRQIDLDRLAATPGGTPAGLIEAFVAPFQAAAHPPLDGRLALEIGGLVVAGDVVRSLRADLVAERGGWRIGRASAQLPGGTTLSGQGAVAIIGDAPGFAGAVDFATTDLGGFRDWLNGGAEAPKTAVRRLAVKGNVTARVGAFTVENATLSADGAASSGRVVWRAAEGGEREHLEADLAADRLDLDALGLDGLVEGALNGGSGLDVKLALNAKALTLLGVAFERVEVDGAADAAGVTVRKLLIGDAGGAKISGSGQIATDQDGPEGSLAFDIDARRLDGLLKLARAAGAPEAVVAELETRAAAIVPARVSVDVETNPARRTLSARGTVAGGPFELAFSAPSFALDAEADLAVELSSPDGRRLAALGGFSLSPAVSVPGGAVSLKLKGVPARGMSGEGRVAAFGLDLAARGDVAVVPEVGVSASGDVTLRSPDLTVVAEAFGRLVPGAAPAVPVDVSVRVALTAEQATIENLKGAVGDAAVTGRLVAPYDMRKGVEGALSFDSLSLAAVAGLALSPDAFAVGGGPRRSVWPSAVFGPSPLGGLAGKVAISAERVVISPDQLATDARFTLVMRPGAVAFENLSASYAGGALKGSVSVARPGPDATVAIRASLEGARVERLTSLRAASPFTGGLDLVLDAQGAGRTVSAVVSTLAGTGSGTLRGGVIRRLDVAALDRIEPRVEAGLALEAPKIAGALENELGAADLDLARAATAFTVSGGVARAGSIDDGGGPTRLGGAIALDLTKLTLDANFLLGPRRDDAPQLGVSFEGPLAAPKRRIDATALTGWLSVRAVERETRRIEAMEADMQQRAKAARERAAEERARAEEKRVAEEARQKLDDERRKREAEERVRNAPPAATPTGPSPTQALPPALDITPPGAGQPSSPGLPLQLGPQRPRAPAQPPQGVFDQR